MTLPEMKTFIWNRNSYPFWYFSDAKDLQKLENAKVADFEIQFDASIKLMKAKCKKYEEHLTKR